MSKRQYFKLLLKAPLLIFVGFLLIHFYLVFTRSLNSAAGSDASGYLTFARFLTEGKFSENLVSKDIFLKNSWNEIGQPMAFVTGQSPTEIVPVYPSGFPLILALFTKFISPPYGIRLTLAFVSVLCIWAIYLLARTVGLSRNWSVSCAMIIGVGRTFIYQTAVPMSDVSATLSAALSVLFAWSGNGSQWRYMALGLSFAMGCLIRPVSILMAIPLSLAFYLKKYSLRDLFWFGLGGFPAFIFFLILNKSNYGHFFTTGYTNMANCFKFEYFYTTLAKMSVWLPDNVFWITFVAFLLSPFYGRKNRDVFLLCWIWFLAFLLFHSFYSFTSENWTYVRFILPALPAVVIAASFTLKRFRLPMLPIKWQRKVWIFLPFFLIGGSFQEYGVSWERAIKFVSYSKNQRKVADWLGANAGPKDVVVSFEISGPIYYHSKMFLCRLDRADKPKWDALVTDAKQNQYSIYAALMPPEYERDIFKSLTGQWEAVATFDDIKIFKFR